MDYDTLMDQISAQTQRTFDQMNELFNDAEVSDEQKNNFLKIQHAWAAITCASVARMSVLAQINPWERSFQTALNGLLAAGVDDIDAVNRAKFIATMCEAYYTKAEVRKDDTAKD